MGRLHNMADASERANAALNTNDISAPENKALEVYWALRPTQRDAFITKLVRSDPELVMVADSMLVLYRRAKTPRELRPLLRPVPRR